MRFDVEIIRDVLIKIEELLECEDDENGWFYINPISWKEIWTDKDLRDSYDAHEIKYTIYKLAKEGFIETLDQEVMSGVASIKINDITQKGYDILNNIRNVKVTDRVKSILGGAKHISVDFISSVASAVLSEMIKQQL